MPTLEYLKLFGEWIKSVRTMFVAGAVAALALFTPERRLEAIHIYPAVDRLRPWLWLVLAISAAGLLYEVGKVILNAGGYVFTWLRLHSPISSSWLWAAVSWVFISLVIVYFARWRLDAVTGIALITLLFMMLQSEHERCDRVRASWREVRKQTFTVTTAIQRAKQKQDHPEAERYLEKAQASINELYSAVLLVYGKGPLREEYRTRFNEAMKTPTLMPLLSVFPILDGKAERMLDAWRLRIL